MSELTFSINKAAILWGTSREGLERRLNELGAFGAEHHDGGWTVAQIDKAIHGDIEEQLKTAQTRKANEDADSRSLDNEQARKNLIDLEDFSKRLEQKAVTCRQSIEALESLDEDQKRDVLNAFATAFESS